MKIQNCGYIGVPDIFEVIAFSAHHIPDVRIRKVKNVEFQGTFANLFSNTVVIFFILMTR